jgi:hypothetical protein
VPTNVLYLCRHCPASLRFDETDEVWLDPAGFYACAEGRLVGGNGELIVHEPLPEGLRGGL